MSVPATAPFTYRDYVRLSDDRRYEVIGGKLLLTPSPRTWHQRVSLNLTIALVEHVREHDLGEVLEAPCDVVLSKTDVVQPDILFIRKDRLDIIGEKFVSAAPDLLVEILSPGTKTRDRKLKFRLYARFGVRELWIVDAPERSVEVYVNAGGRFRLGERYSFRKTLCSKILPRLRIPLASIF
jgi:Uma2 family endonuclease